MVAQAAQVDNNLKSPKPFIDLAANIFAERGENSTFPGMNPVVRRYLEEARKGSYRTPEEVQQALTDMKEQMIQEYFPDEYAQREASRVAEGTRQARAARQKAMAENPRDYDSEGNMLEDVVAARRMNEGGMMQNPVMQRPMFQTPMQREGMGIMAGVAPIQGFAEGGDAEDSEAEDSLGSELFRILIVDVDDPVDVALSSAAAGMAATGIGGPAALLAKLAGIGRKLFKGSDAAAKAAFKAKEKVERMEEAGLFRQAASKTGEKAGSFLAEKEALTFLRDPVDYAKGIGEIFEEQPIEKSGGIGSLPVVNMAGGGILRLLGNVFKKNKKKDTKEDTKEDEISDELSYPPMQRMMEDMNAPKVTEQATKGLTAKQKARRSAAAVTAATGAAGAIGYGLVDGEEPPEMVSPDGNILLRPESDAAAADDEEELSPLGRLLEGLSSDRIAYQFAKAAQPSEGFVPRNLASDLVLAGEEYDRLQKDETALVSNLTALQELMPEANTEDLINLLLGKDPKTALVEQRLSLFEAILKDPSRNYVDLEDGTTRPKTPAEINAEVDAMMMAATGEAPAATGVRVMTQEEMDRYSQAN